MDNNKISDIPWDELSGERQWAESIADSVVKEFEPLIRKEIFDALMRGVRFGVMLERRNQIKLLSEVRKEKEK